MKVVVDADLVARRDLAGQTDGADLLVIGAARLGVRILGPGPLRRVADVQVAVQPGVVGVVAERPGGPEEPEPIAEQWSADRQTGVFFQAEDGIRDLAVTGVQTCALPIYQLGHFAPQGELAAEAEN